MHKTISKISTLATALQNNITTNEEILKYLIESWGITNTQINQSIFEMKLIKNHINECDLN